ncbi:hypothetical protein PTKIN_Ptkin11bG0077900 [Pterospermum kingtungense]
MFEDCFGQDSKSKAPRERKLGLRQNDLTELIRAWVRMSEAEQNDFKEKYGHIADLLLVHVDKNILKETFEFWDPSYCCFSFQNIYLTPTLEEYSVLMGFELKHLMKVYVRQNSFKPWIDKLSKILRVRTEDIEGYVKMNLGKACLTMDFLLRFIREHLNEDVEKISLALAINGLVLFPMFMGYVDSEVVHFFERVQKGSINPIPSVLAETIRYLNFYGHNMNESLAGCAQLLVIWLKGHLVETKKYFDLSRKEPPVQHFCEAWV